jgi:uncharacterized protein YdhG (YjbR/CyaY superfamily)
MSDTKSGFSADERAAMAQRAEELRSTKGLKGAAKQAAELEACIAAIDALTGTDREVATLLHRVVAEEAPQLAPKTWYGFPSYAREEGGRLLPAGIEVRHPIRHGGLPGGRAAGRR